MTLLTICQNAAKTIGIPAPSAIISATDTSSKQLLATANTEGKQLARNYPWNILIKEGSFTTAATESQGAMTTIASDFARFSNNTLWNRTTDRKYYGPITDAEWQRIKATVNAGVTNYFRIRGGNLIITPTATASESVFFEYISKNWVDTGSDGAADSTEFAGDSNTSVIDEHLLTLGVVWRFLKLKGLPYDQQFIEYQGTLKEYAAQDGAKPILRTGMAPNFVLATNVPEGNYAGV